MGGWTALEPLITLTTNLYPPTCILDLSPWFSHAGIKEPHCGQQYLLWQRIMTSVSQQSTPAPIWLAQHSAAEKYFEHFMWVCSEHVSRFLCDLSNLVRRQCFFEKGCLVGHNGRHRFLHTLIGRQLSSKSRAFCIESGCFSTMQQTDARPSNANYNRQSLWRMCQLEQTSVQLTRPRGHHSFLD